MPTKTTNKSRKTKPSEAQVRQALRRLGVRRDRLRKEEKALHKDTKAALKQANGVIPVSEAAELLGLNRSTVYEVYRGGRERRNGNKPEEKG